MNTHILTHTYRHIITPPGSICGCFFLENVKASIRHMHVFITWQILTFTRHIYSFLFFFLLLICLLWNSWRLGHSWIPSISSCLCFSPASSNAVFPLGSLPRQRHHPSLQCLGVKYAGLKIFIHFIQTTAKKKNPVLGPGVAGFFSPGPLLQFLRTEKVWGWCPILPGQGRHVISLVRMSLMPFSLDPNTECGMLHL